MWLEIQNPSRDSVSQNKYISFEKKWGKGAEDRQFFVCYASPRTRWCELGYSIVGEKKKSVICRSLTPPLLVVV